MRTIANRITLVGYACGLGGKDSVCDRGPACMKHSAFLEQLKDYLTWQEVVTFSHKEKLQALTDIATISHELAQITSNLVTHQKFFITIGGDHTSAIGTWSGVAAAIAPHSLGLLWIDAHLDSHTPANTVSGNIHGMPLAILLGYGDKALTEVSGPYPKLLPENVCVVGARSFEPEERQLLEQLHVPIFYMEDIEQRGFNTIMAEALTLIRRNTRYFGFTLDLDAITPEEAPGVSNPEPHGIKAKQLYKEIEALTQEPGFIAAEISEFNPDLDRNHQTEIIIATIIDIIIRRELLEQTFLSHLS
jgi:arginase